MPDDRRDRAEGLRGDRDRVRRHAVEHGRLPVERGGEALGAAAAGDHRRRRARPRRPRARPSCAAPGSLLTGPIVVASSSGSPRRTSRSTSPASSSTNSSRTASCTSRRSAAEQLWPAPRKRAHAGGLGRGREVGVVHHHERPVAAHLEQLRLAGARLARHDQAGLGRAGEGHRARAGIDRQLVAHLGARAQHHVEHARRQVGLGHALGQQARADGGRGRRRPDHAVAAGQRGREHLGGHRVGPVPGRDQAEHARAGGAAAARGGRARRSRGSCPPRACRPRRPCGRTRSARRPRPRPPP